MPALSISQSSTEATTVSLLRVRIRLVCVVRCGVVASERIKHCGAAGNAGFPTTFLEQTCVEM